MITETWPCERIQPYEDNPRNNEPAIEAVMKSIQEFGFRQPIVVDEDDVIIVGHTRFMAAQRLGLKEVPVHVARGLSPEQIRAYRIADNKTAEFATWDLDKLAIEIGALSEAGFDLGSLSLSDAELTALLDAGRDPEPEDPESIPAPGRTAVSVPRAMYSLGNHRLLVGDATSPEDVATLTGGQLAMLLLTDPPYNVAYEGGTDEHLTIENDCMDDESFREFLRAALTAVDPVMAPGATFYIWHADSEGYNFRGACRDVGWPVRQCLIWVKNALVLGRQDYHWRHESCLTGWKPGAAHRWFSDRKQSTVLEFDRPSRSDDHPTMKPVELFRYQMQNSSAPGDLVLDPFAGSGTTVIAAEQAGRRARVLELDPIYADVIRKRWVGYVHGEDADWQDLTPEVSRDDS